MEKHPMVRGQVILIVSGILSIGLALGLWLWPGGSPAAATTGLTVRDQKPRALDVLGPVRRERGEKKIEDGQAPLAAVYQLKDKADAGKDAAQALREELIRQELKLGIRKLAEVKHKVKRLRYKIDHFAKHGSGADVAEAEIRAAEAADETLLGYQAEKEQVRTILEGIKAKSPRGAEEPKAKPWQDRMGQIDQAMKARRVELLATLAEAAKKEGLTRLDALKKRLVFLEGLAKALEADTLELQRKVMGQAAKGLGRADFDRETAQAEE